MWKDDLPPNRATTAKELDALRVECPTCGAKVSDRCQWPRNVGKDRALYHCDPHASRIGLASDRGFGYVPGYPPPLEGNENKIY